MSKSIDESRERVEFSRLANGRYAGVFDPFSWNHWLDIDDYSFSLLRRSLGAHFNFQRASPYWGESSFKSFRGEEMRYSFDLAKLALGVYKVFLFFMLANIFTLAVIASFYHFQPASYWLEYESLTTPIYQKQGKDTPVVSRYKVKRADTRVEYDDRILCVYPDGTVDRTERQRGDFTFSDRIFSGYPINEIPEGFDESERRLGRSQWIYRWLENDVPPVGSKCRVESHTVVKPFYGFMTKRLPVEFSNEFTIVDKGWSKLPEN